MRIQTSGLIAGVCVALAMPAVARASYTITDDLEPRNTRQCRILPTPVAFEGAYLFRAGRGRVGGDGVRNAVILPFGGPSLSGGHSGKKMKGKE